MLGAEREGQGQEGRSSQLLPHPPPASSLLPSQLVPHSRPQRRGSFQRVPFKWLPLDLHLSSLAGPAPCQLLQAKPPRLQCQTPGPESAGLRGVEGRTWGPGTEGNVVCILLSPGHQTNSGAGVSKSELRRPTMPAAKTVRLGPRLPQLGRGVEKLSAWCGTAARAGGCQGRRLPSPGSSQHLDPKQPHSSLQGLYRLGHPFLDLRSLPHLPNSSQRGPRPGERGYTQKKK